MLLSADALAAADQPPVIISEFVADNRASLLTRTRASEADAFEGDPISPDWIELLNISGQPVDLGGMHLTDDAADPTQWEFPAGTTIGAGEFLIVFASGSDIRDPALDQLGALHTNFRLSRRGEYLGLTDRDGAVLYDFGPSYPAQRTDVSYSLAMDYAKLIGRAADIEYLVPQDDSLGADWQLPGYSNPDLIGGAASPIGFDRGDGPFEPGETVGGEVIDRSSTDFSRGSIVVLEGHPFTSAGQVIEWSFFSTASRTITPLILKSGRGGFEIVGVGRTRTSDGSGLQRFAFDLQSGSDTVDANTYFFGFKDGDRQTDELGVVGYSRSDTDVVRRYNGPQSRNMVVGKQLGSGRKVARTYSVQATTRARLAGPFTTDVGAAIGEGSSLYVRYPFVLDARSEVDTLELKIRYEDGFVAYLNGTQVAQRNVAEPVRFDSTALANRPFADANRLETINISESIGALREGENVLAVHGLNDAAGGSEMLIDLRLRGIDLPDLNQFGFAADPTPGARSGQLFSGLLAPPAFSHERGLYSEPFTLELTPPSPGAAIYYTLDGSDPGPENGSAKRYQSPLSIEGTTLLRAAAFEEGLLPSQPQTHSYLFPSDIITQDTLQSAVIDNPKWRPQLIDSLKALPTVSVVSADRVMPAEIPASIEMIFPDGREGFQVDAGIEEFGGTGSSFAKRSMRVSFKKIYGPSMLDFDVFDDPQGVTQFDQLVLRGGSHDSPFWTHSQASGPGSYIRNRWVFDRQLELGQPAPRGRFVQLYLNGTYWGMYHLLERPNAAFAASLYGGDAADYDVMKAGEVLDGDDRAWNKLIDTIDDGYEALQQILDVENYADYVLVQFYGGNFVDWGPNSNWIAVRRREPGARFRFIPWDNDIVIRSPAELNVDIVYFPGPGHLWTINGGVRQYPEFRRLLAERAQKLFFDGGMLTDERVRGQMDAFIESLQLPVIMETARFGAGTYTPDSWLEAVEWIKENYAPVGEASRAATVVEQLRHAGLFPLIDRPSLDVDGQAVEGDSVAPGSLLQLDAPQGDIYYTLDGTDPWERTPAVDYTSLVGDDSRVRVLVPSDGTLGTDWRDPEFDDSSWSEGPNGVGYDTTGDLTPLIQFDIQDQMFDVNTTAYMRIDFDVDDPSQFETLELMMRYDDGFVAHLNGTEVARRNARDPLAWNSRATRPQRDVESREFERFNLTREMGLLRPGRNVLTIQALNIAGASGADNVDLLMTPLLRAGKVTDAGLAPTAVRYTGPVVLPAGATFKARALSADQWSTLREVAAQGHALPLRISEVMYHPADPTEAERAAGYDDADAFEFIELVNISDAPIDLTGAQLVESNDGGRVEGVVFDFGRGAIGELGPGERVLVVENTAAFAARYGTGLPVAGSWQGRLSNAAEQLTLVSGGETIQQFRYQDAWYPNTDGGGRSLEIVRERSPMLDRWNRADGWLPSIVDGGTPGAPRSAVTVPAGDLNLDGTTDLSDVRDLVFALRMPDEYQARFGVPAALAGDTDGDGDLDHDDIAGFVAALDADDGSGARGAAIGKSDRNERRRLKREQGRRVEKEGGGDLVGRSRWAARVDRLLTGGPS